MAIISIYFLAYAIAFVVMAAQIFAADLQKSEKGKLDPRDLDLLNACFRGVFEDASRAISSGANIDARDGSNGNTPLIWASFGGHIEIMEILIAGGAEIDAQSSDGMKTPLLAAAYNGKHEAVDLLILQGASVNRKNSRGDSPLLLAAYMGHSNVVGTLLERRSSEIDIDLQINKYRQSALHLAILKDKADIVKTLVDNFANINTADVSGITPLMLAAMNGLEEICRVLVKAGGANLEMREKKSASTALSLAAEHNRLSCLHILIDAGADLEATNASGQTPLLRAVARGHEDVVKALLVAGANLRAEDSNNRDAVGVAEASGQTIVHMLLLAFLKDHPRSDDDRDASSDTIEL